MGSAQRRSDESKKKQSETMKRKYSDPQYRARLKAATAVPKDNRSEIMKRKWQDPQYRAKMLEVFRSEDRRNKISNTLKGRRVGFATGNYEFSDEAKRKIGDAHKGNTYAKGNKLSEEHKRAISQSLIGNSHTKGMHLSEAHKRKVGVASKRNWANLDYRNKVISANTGKKRSKESRNNMSRATCKAILEGRFCIPSRGKHGTFKSKKLGRQFHYRSSWELEVLHILEDCKDVTYYDVESEAVSYEYNGITSRYIPDFYIEFADGDWRMIEVKPKYLLADPVVQAKTKAAETKYGDHYQIWTEDTIFGAGMDFDIYTVPYTSIFVD